MNNLRKIYFNGLDKVFFKKSECNKHLRKFEDPIH